MWSSPRTVLSIDDHSGMVKIPGNSGRPISAAVEDLRLAITKDEFSKHPIETNYQLPAIVDDLADNLSSDGDPSSDLHTIVEPNDSNNFNHDGEPLSQPAIGDRAEVFWPDDDHCYPGVINSLT